MPSTEEDERAQCALIDEIRTYANGRMSDVERGAETPEFAALLTEKVGWGMNLAARALGFRVAAFVPEVDRLVARIDPEFAEHRRKRWAARPARVGD